MQQGQVLFTLDRRPLELALREAQANLERDTARAENAALMTKRYEDLAKRGIATREQVDTSRSDVNALNATVSADKAAVENATVQLDYATIKAPISGRTGALMVHEGNLVRANDTTPLVTINQIMPISVAFSVPEARLSDLKRYMSAGSLKVTATPSQRRGTGRSRTDRVRGQRGRREHAGRFASRARFPMRTGSSGPASSSTSS